MDGRMISRRMLLTGGAAAVAGALGVAVGVFRSSEPRGRPVPPSWLLAALAQERSLLDGLAGVPADQVRPAVVSVIRADHAAHARALEQLVARYGGSAAATSSGPSFGRVNRAQLRAAEQVAAGEAGKVAGSLFGANAALLASIAACEAVHGQVLL